MLCQTCQNIFRGTFPVTYWDWDHSIDMGRRTSAESLQQSAIQGCHICRILWDKLLDHTPRRDTKCDWYILPLSAAEGDIMEFQLKIGTGEGDFSGGISVDFALDELCDGVFGDQTSRSTLIEFIVDDGCVCFSGEYDPADWSSSMLSARNWLSQCSGKHTKCKVSRSARDTSFLPTRLLEIGQPEPHKIRLQLSSNQSDASSGYATLSHCWGKSRVLKLTSASFHNLKTGVEISELGQTFQDAIFTARSLDIGLLWIDSLCIFQDSEADWQQESANMSQVYSNSMLNIAASIAADSEAGCFPERPSFSLDSCFVQTNWDHHENGTYRLCKKLQWEGTLATMPLTERAWVVQETLLAPRVLYLCGSQLFWECYDLQACEQFPNALPQAHLVDWKLSTVRRCSRYSRYRNLGFRSLPPETLHEAFGMPSKLIPMNRRTKDSQNAIWQLWRDVIITYTSCSLTYTNDKLVALSGIARIMEQVLNDEYIAGLWKSRLATELGWRPSQPLSKSDSGTYRAPSWSWASRDGAIKPGHVFEDSECLINIIHCQVRTATADRTGAVVSGILRLTCWLATIQFCLPGEPDDQRSLHCFLDGKHVELGIVSKNIDDPHQSSQLHCLPLSASPQTLPCWIPVYCLLLVPAGTIRGQFRRVGFICLNICALEWDLWTDFAYVKNESWLEYETDCGNGRYIISII